MFVVPTLALLGFFVLWPIVDAIYHSFYNWTPQSTSFAGLGNYRTLINTPIFWQILRNNLILLVSIPIWVLVPLVLAFLLFTQVPGWKLFRLVLFAPTALSWVVIGTVWHYIFSYDGPINDVLRLLRLPGPDWLSHGGTAMAAIIVTAVWASVGTGLLIYLAGLSAIPPEIFESATVDGAGFWRTLFRIVLPLTSRYVVFFTTLCLITAFTGLFALIYVMTAGGPGFSTTTMEYYIYVDAFTNSNFGQAATVGVLLFAITLVITLLQMRALRTEKWQ